MELLELKINGNKSTRKVVTIRKIISKLMSCGNDIWRNKLIITVEDSDKNKFPVGDILENDKNIGLWLDKTDIGIQKHSPVAILMTKYNAVALGDLIDKPVTVKLSDRKFYSFDI